MTLADIATLLAHVDRLRDLAAALEAELARASAICTAHGIDPDGCTDCFVATTADLPHPPVTHPGERRGDRQMELEEDEG